MKSSQLSNKAQLVHDRLANGLIPATPVPLDAGGNLHSGAHKSYLSYMAQPPLAGVAVWAHTGRGIMLNRETRSTILRDWRASLPHGVIVAGTGSFSTHFDEATAGAIEMAESAAELGADALLVYPP